MFLLSIRSRWMGINPKNGYFYLSLSLSHSHSYFLFLFYSSSKSVTSHTNSRLFFFYLSLTNTTIFCIHNHKILCGKWNGTKWSEMEKNWRNRLNANYAAVQLIYLVYFRRYVTTKFNSIQFNRVKRQHSEKRKNKREIWIFSCLFVSVSLL